MPNGLTVHQGLPDSMVCSRTSAMERYDAAPRSIGALPPPAAAAQLAARNSSLVATRSWGPPRARSRSRAPPRGWETRHVGVGRHQVDEQLHLVDEDRCQRLHALDRDAGGDLVGQLEELR